MARGWATDDQSCDVDDDGVHFDMLGRTPLDMAWGCPLEQYLTDPDYAAHVRERFRAGTEEQVHAEVVATLLKLGRPVPETAPPRPVSSPPALVAVGAPGPLPLPRGQGDGSGLALAQLLVRIARAVAPMGEWSQAAPLAWGPLDQEDNHAPLRRIAWLGPVELQREVDWARAFSQFRARVIELPPGVVVSATWDGEDGLRVDVRAPGSAEPSVRALLGAPFLQFHVLG
jgi:hypothetical protein